MKTNPIIIALDVESADEARARELSLSDAMRFTGALPARKAFALGRLMVVPSRAESLPYVILEAAAAAQPLLATRVGGIPEIFGPRADELVPPADAPALAAAIERELGVPESVRSGKAEALREFVRGRFTLPGMVDGGLAGYAAAFRSIPAAR